LKNLAALPLELPDRFDVEIAYVDHRQAHKLSFFPGVRKMDDRTVMFEETDYFEVLRKLLFLL
jgi:D-amino peptidase